MRSDTTTTSTAAVVSLIVLVVMVAIPQIHPIAGVLGGGFVMLVSVLLPMMIQAVMNGYGLDNNAQSDASTDQRPGVVETPDEDPRISDGVAENFSPIDDVTEQYLDGEITDAELDEELERAVAAEEGRPEDSATRPVIKDSRTSTRYNSKSRRR